ncbi:hypothetical protein [Pseudonocardia sp. HH130630-07]|uniref:hypothetical protein n=1 Tax=Pseudonocardia sp. HH130630-07 TaxID=1690815 RepID=UPI000814DA38|nr:hypothetical protein [Pseudonocardia sp. HH130630-07]ANY05132.1 hypothetical protein AFB00_00995 [Pseudonocardia sp. HH130630-07]
MGREDPPYGPSGPGPNPAAGPGDGEDGDAVLAAIAHRLRARSERQQLLTERLRTGELRPGALADLAELAGAARRGVRDGEHILVLAGAPRGPRLAAPPAPLGQTLNTIVAASEAASRTVVPPTPSVSVSAAAEPVLAQILAELLAHAAGATPAGERLELQTRWGPDGGVVVELQSATPPRLQSPIDELDRALGSATPAGPVAPQEIGLHVAARLARAIGARLGIRGPAGNTGVTPVAVLHLPSSVVGGGQQPAAADPRTQAVPAQEAAAAGSDGADAESPWPPQPAGVREIPVADPEPAWPPAAQGGAQQPGDAQRPAEPTGNAPGGEAAAASWPARSAAGQDGGGPGQDRVAVPNRPQPMTGPGLQLPTSGRRQDVAAQGPEHQGSGRPGTPGAPGPGQQFPGGPNLPAGPGVPGPGQQVPGQQVASQQFPGPNGPGQHGPGQQGPGHQGQSQHGPGQPGSAPPGRPGPHEPDAAGQSGATQVSFPHGGPPPSGPAQPGTGIPGPPRQGPGEPGPGPGAGPPTPPGQSSGTPARSASDDVPPATAALPLSGSADATPPVELFGPFDSEVPVPVDDADDTPIFASVASAWFREPAAPTAPPATNGAATPRDDWRTPGDAEFDAARIRADRVVDLPTTSRGLPQRLPGQAMVPPPWRETAGGSQAGASRERQPDRVRNRLASYQRGLRDGRHRAAEDHGAEAVGGAPAVVNGHGSNGHRLNGEGGRNAG